MSLGSGLNDRWLVYHCVLLMKQGLKYMLMYFVNLAPRADGQAVLGLHTGKWLWLIEQSSCCN